MKTWARQWPGRRSPQWSRSAGETHCCQSVSSRVYHANAIWNAICLVAQQNKIWIDSDFILIYLCFVYRSCLEERDGANNSSEKLCHLQPLVKFLKKDIWKYCHFCKQCSTHDWILNSSYCPFGLWNVLAFSGVISTCVLIANADTHSRHSECGSHGDFLGKSEKREIFCWGELSSTPHPPNL